jgi:hypothetical protein
MITVEKVQSTKENYLEIESLVLVLGLETVLGILYTVCYDQEKYAMTYRKTNEARLWGKATQYLSQTADKVAALGM